MLKWSLRHYVDLRSKAVHFPRSRFASRESTRKPFSHSCSSRNVQGPASVRGRFSQHVHTWTGYAILGLKAVVPLYLFAHVGLNYFYQYSPAYGISMLPTIHSFGEWVLISKYYRRGRGVVVGDLVSFKHPVKEGEQAIKRVVGLSGDFVLMNTPEKSSAMIQIPEGHCWVVGDNLLHSRDSRMFGPLPMALISGKIVAKVRVERGRLPSASWIGDGLNPAVEDDD